MMDKWFLSAEFFSLILMFILTLNFYDRRWNEFSQRKLYNLCLLTSTASILLNILCVYTIQYSWYLPLWVNLLCNSVYFLLIVTVSSIIAYYLMNLLYEHIYQRNGLQDFKKLLIFLYAVYVVLLLYNIQSGILFFFDQNRNYNRGPFINAGYGIMLFQLLVLIAFTSRNRNSISKNMRRVMKILPPVILLLTTYQILYPEVLLNGGIIVAANMILLVNFQSCRLEQDSLTSCGNRISFHQEIQLRLGGHQQFQVIAISIHQFRNINYSYGHQKGDHLLYEIANWLDHQHSLGSSFRIGNMEFALLLPYQGIVSAEKMITTIYERFQQPWVLGEIQVRLSASLAELIYTDQPWSATNLMEFLNFSLSFAKDRENHVVRFDTAIYQKMEQHNQLMIQMQKSIRDHLFHVWYQPIYNCHTGKFDMAEALVRMVDAQGNSISPKLFVPLAEEYELIQGISRDILEKVGNLLTRTTPDQLASISVNLSMQQFLSASFLPELDAWLQRYSFDPNRLTLEVTERVLASDLVQMQNVMTLLHEKGIRLALDDFGTGYSNLSVILNCPFSHIKLDQSLIRQYTENERSQVITHTLLELFHQMHFKVIIEGVETKAQADALTNHKADYIQGYYFAHPMPEDKFLSFLHLDSPQI